MAPRVFIDGQAGTIGLRIRELLRDRRDLDVVEIDPERRKDPKARAALLLEADLAVLCLPDEAAREAVALAADSKVRIIDGSSAHRVDADFTYGLAELEPSQRAAIAAAKRVSNPGCYPTAVALLLRPLTAAGLLPEGAPIVVHALSGYSGGGRAMIERWEAADSGLLHLPYPAPYGVHRRHKHVAEMMRYGGLRHPPQFLPSVGPFRRGLRVEIPLHAALVGETGAERLHACLRDRYANEAFVQVEPLVTQPTHERSFNPRSCDGTNRVRLFVCGHDDGHVLLVGLLDNLGKGASGAAVQNLNLMLGLPEDRGLGG